MQYAEESEESLVTTAAGVGTTRHEHITIRLDTHNKRNCRDNNGGNNNNDQFSQKKIVVQIFIIVLFCLQIIAPVTKKTKQITRSRHCRGLFI